jgi:hypothetical protein
MLVHIPFPSRSRGRRGRPRGLNAGGVIAAHPPIAGVAATVQVVLPADHDRTNLRDCAFSFALDQRAFGPRRVLVGIADRDGRFRGLAHVERPDPPELALAPCLEALMSEIRRGASAAVVWCDEPVTDGPPPADLADRFGAWRAHADQYGVRLVDWFACDDWFMRSTQLAVDPQEGWWELR